MSVPPFINSQPNAAWNSSRPTPPRINIPTVLTSLAILVRNAVQNSQLEFLRHYDWEEFLMTPNTLGWQYESRRTAQLVLPFLFLGPLACCRDKIFLEMRRISMVVGIRSRPPHEASTSSGAVRVAEELGIDWQTFHVPSNQALISAFPKIANAINKHLADRRELAVAGGQVSDGEVSPALGRVLVYCESGNEKSAAAVAAYTMEVLNLGLMDAIQSLQQRRFCISVDDDLKHLLFGYQDVLEAKRHVKASHQSTATPDNAGLNIRKRTMDQDGDDDMEWDDKVRFQERAFVPYTDADAWTSVGCS